MAIFVEEQTGKVSVKIPLNADGNIAQSGDTATSQKTVNFPGFIKGGSLSQANVLFSNFLGTIAGTNYDSLSAVRTDTATVGQGQSQAFQVSVSDEDITLGNGETVSITTISNAETISINVNPSATDNYTSATNNKVVSFTRIGTNSFANSVTLTSSAAGYDDGTAIINVNGFSV